MYVCVCGRGSTHALQSVPACHNNQSCVVLEGCSQRATATVSCAQTHCLNRPRPLHTNWVSHYLVLINWLSMLCRLAGACVQEGAHQLFSVVCPCTIWCACARVCLSFLFPHDVVPRSSCQKVAPTGPQHSSVATYTGRPACVHGCSRSLAAHNATTRGSAGLWTGWLVGWSSHHWCVWGYG